MVLPEKKIERTASCVCGALTVATRGDPSHSMLCSCTSCRRKSGSAFNWSTYWPEHNVTISGPSKAFRRDAQDGRSIEQNFCQECGSALWWRADFAPGSIGVSGGSFDGPALPRPSRAFWTEQRPDWVCDIAGIPAKPRQ